MSFGRRICLFTFLKTDYAMTNRTAILLVIFFLSCTLSALAQRQVSPDQLAVESVIKELFSGMQRGDSAQVHATFTKELSMATVLRKKQGIPVVHWENTLTGF